MTDYFGDYFFASNSSGYVCPGFASFKCEPKAGACARDPNNGKRYCCDYAEVCWGRTSKCASDGSTIDCGDGSNSWCCLNGTEICTQTAGQINICWASPHDTLTNISSGSLVSLYSSLSSASPTASSYTFDPLKLIAATATTSSITQSTGHSSSRTPSSSSTASSSTSASATATASPSSSISRGAIAGVVIAILAALALLAGGFFLFSRKGKQKKDVYEADAKEHPGKPGTPSQHYAPQELASSNERSELPASHARTAPVELPACPTG
ncbi:hypothetical protein EG328_005719 [Venturia inaequalis]|uniref:Uncharacterized protein n=1 Tax=Venturia inaequalis TaxID=5025 RepID=A0A8H3UH86_VENIN|nr:hypothetical protein EG327_010566 [Venturia inaequalis]KAE9971358.1 hypothetical protein EG328_005719 [Venturia inaequalis]RDI87279.1 hypothetical protein Vi05172_g2721 [Venturia inaequalis]